jgi:hypothetical protein
MRHRPSLAVALLAAAAAPGVGAATLPRPSAPTAAAVPVARGHVAIPVVDDELMVSDPANPRILRSKRPGVIDRKWIERTAMPRIPAAVMDEIERVAPPPIGDRVLRSPEAPPLAGAAIAVDGNVLVIEGTSNLVVQGQNGLGFNHNDGSFDIINTVLGRFGDNYDFITVFTTFPDNGVAAYYFPIKQDTDGLGECDFQNGRTFGCLFDQTQGQLEQLQGFVFMNSLATWQDWDTNYDGVVHPFTSFDSGVYSTLGQEVAHRWGSGLRFVDRRNDRVSNLLLGRDDSHWAAYVDTDASVMDGWDWVEDGDDFDLVGDMDRFNTLDLYTMGANPVASAQPFFVIEQARFKVEGTDRIGINGAAIPADAVLQLPSDALMEAVGMRVGARGTSVPVTIQDVVDAEGNRCPDPDATQKTFKQAVVLVTRPGQTIAQVSGIVEDLNVVLATWEDWWLDRTAKKLKLCTALNEDCVHAAMSLSGGALTHDGASLQPGTSGTATFTIAAQNTTVTNARLRVVITTDTADFLTVPAEFELGDIAPGEDKVVEIPIDIAADYPCGTSSALALTLEADNAASVTEELNFFPGYRKVFVEEFADDDHGFEVNGDGKDGTVGGRNGALAYTSKVELTCDMSKRSAERDASPGNAGAFVTGPGTDHVPNLLDEDAGEGAELDGDTSLWSPTIDLTGTNAPEVRFAYWFDGDDGDEMLVQISGDGGATFTTGKTITDSFHGWVVGRVGVRETLGNVPESLIIRFIVTGGGTLEAGIDDVRVLDFDGACASALTCGCDAAGTSSPAAPVAALVAAWALDRTRRRRRADSEPTPVR